MIYISHRGNIDAIIPEKENSPNYIDEAISQGYDVEIDVRLIDKKFYLGHDAPDHLIDLNWLLKRKNSLWVHCKNYAALSSLLHQDLKIFYHQKENHTIIGGSLFIWSHDLSEADGNSIIPLLSLEDVAHWKCKLVAGVCSDFIKILRDKETSAI